MSVVDHKVWLRSSAQRPFVPGDDYGHTSRESDDSRGVGGDVAGGDRERSGRVWTSWRAHRQILAAVHVLVMCTVVAACGGSGCTDSDFADQVVAERTVDVAYRGPSTSADAVMDQPAPRLVVQISNYQPSVERLRLKLDGEEALDIDLPRALGCQGEMVFSIAYDRPAGPVSVDLDIQGSTSTTVIELPDTGTVWADIQIQAQRAWGDPSLFDAEPDRG